MSRRSGQDWSKGLTPWCDANLDWCCDVRYLRFDRLIVVL